MWLSRTAFSRIFEECKKRKFGGGASIGGRVGGEGIVVDAFQGELGGSGGTETRPKRIFITKNSTLF
jgi:hypothetical protein